MSFVRAAVRALFYPPKRGAVQHVFQCVRIDCEYCPDGYRYAAEACSIHEPAEALSDILAHMITEHWTELLRVRELATGEPAPIPHTDSRPTQPPVDDSPA